MKSMLFCISGPSGVGKGTLVRELLRRDPSLALSVSCTTRRPRKGERDGVEYFFISHSAFMKGIEEDAFIEYDGHFREYYGTPRGYVAEQLEAGRSVLLEIDVNGALKVRGSEKETPVSTIFIVPPSREALEARLKGRASETEEQVAERQARVDYEYSRMKEFDHVVLNDDLNAAVQELLDIIHSEINK